MRIKYHTDRNTVVLAMMPVAVIMVDGGGGGEWRKRLIDNLRSKSVWLCICITGAVILAIRWLISPDTCYI